MKKYILTISILVTLFLMSACNIGPDYQKPKMNIAKSFKEAPKGWKIAEPRDSIDKGQWWQVFKEPKLNALMKKVDISNQNIAIAVAQYQQALALVKEASANYWPTVGLTAGSSREEKIISNSANANISWSPDFFGIVARAKEASIAGAQASAAQLADTKLSTQALLAQTYFQLQALDVTQKLLDDAVSDYKKLLKLTTNRYNAGIATRLDIIQSQTQLQSATALALDNQISRAQYEHAIAVLIGQIPSQFSLKFKNPTLIMPKIPLCAPSHLLERRPDIAQAERLIAQANAQIGLAQAAFFPSLTLTGSYGYVNNSLTNLFSTSNQLWSLGAQVAETLIDGGTRSAKIDSALAAYEQSVASYKQTVLNAFQQVEDNLVALRVLESEIIVQNSTIASADLALQITINQYKSGTATYDNVIDSMNTYYTAKQTAASLYSRQMVAAVSLIQALGGSWKANK
jgi:NodT family efflux transporter outer membrane factor (OMF) lipoprotein